MALLAAESDSIGEPQRADRRIMSGNMQAARAMLSRVAGDGQLVKPELSHEYQDSLHLMGRRG